MVNKGLQVFDKTTGASLLGPIDIATLWSGFGGVCENNGRGDPIVLYDQLANRWVVSQFAGTSIATDECVAVSTTSDAAGNYHRYDFHLGSDFFDYPKLGVWPDAYYMGMNVFNPTGTAYLGPQPFALDRTAMLTGSAATFVTTASPLSPSLGLLLPADLDGNNPPPAGAPHPWMGATGATWPVYRFHVDFTTPANSTFTLAAPLIPAVYTELCSSTRNCVPQLGTTDGLDDIGDRPMFRLAYRSFNDGHEALVGNRTVSSSGVGAIRWWEVNHATSGTPSFVQESTYQPDTTWRWLGSVAMDAQGNLALGFSASSSSIYPQIRYAGRLATDPLGILAQGEATLYAGTGSQTGTSNRWGDYSDLTIDPVDDCTFWYTNEYYATTSPFNWRTRIGSFKFSSCSAPSDFSITANPVAQQVCAVGVVTSTVTLAPFAGFSQAVTLSDSGVPAGITTSFSLNPVTPPGSSIYSINVGGGTADGIYNLVVTGQALTLTHAVSVTLQVNSTTPGAPVLTSPADGTLNLPLTGANYQWTAVAGAASYHLQIDDNADFSSPAVDVSGLANNNYTLAGALIPSTLYYWRVSAANGCGETFTEAFTFGTVGQPGTCGLGSTPVVVYSDDFETGMPGWTHSGTGDTWASSVARSHSPVLSFFAQDPPSVSDQRLVSPAVTLPTNLSGLTFQFWNHQTMESTTGGCFDGGILELTTNGGSTWNQVTSGLLTDPYNGPIASAFGNPLAGLNAWCGNPQDWLNSVVDLSAYAGQTLYFRFRLGSDSSIGREGWFIDDVVVQGCAPLTYTLAVNTVGDGVVNQNPSLPNYDFGQAVTLTAVTDPGWAFTGWSGAMSGSANPKALTIYGNTVVTATFDAITYTLDVNVIGSGSVTVNPTQPSYLYGEVITLTATAQSGWVFVGWDGDASGSANPLTIPITADMQVVAIFEQSSIPQYLPLMRKN